MSTGLLLVLLLHTTEGEPLGAAREAFARGDYDSAATLALAEAHPPHEGQALYLAGLARFRAGRPGDALAALDAAGAAQDAPPRAEWQFNRGACLYDLGQFPEAERAFVEAAEGAPRLAALALANAAFAAFDAGDRDGARARSAQARALGDPVAAPLLDDLDAQLTRERGRVLVRRAAEALGSGDRVEARRRAREALSSPLDPADAARARALVDATSPGLRARGTGWDLTLRAGMAYDSNVLQSGARGTQDYVPIATGEIGSIGLLGSLAAGVRARIVDRLQLEAGYGLEQSAWLASDAEDYSLQLHTVAGAAEWEASDSFRLGVGVIGQWTFTGLSAFRSLQAAAGTSAWMALDETDATTTRVEAAWTRKWGSGSEFEYLSGHRVDAGVAQQLRLRSSVVELAYRFRDESIGTLVTSSVAPLRIPGCGMVPCPIEYTEPFSYRSHALLLAGRTPIGSAVQLGAMAGFEWRSYRGEDVLRATVPGTMMSGPQVVEVFREQREDRRFLAILYATWRITPSLSLAARYDLVVNASTIQNTFDDRNYTKQVATLESVVAW